MRLRYWLREIGILLIIGVVLFALSFAVGRTFEIDAGWLWGV